jgi:hypothetical protein
VVELHNPEHHQPQAVPLVVIILTVLVDVVGLDIHAVIQQVIHSQVIVRVYIQQHVVDIAWFINVWDVVFLIMMGVVNISPAVVLPVVFYSLVVVLVNKR